MADRDQAPPLKQRSLAFTGQALRQQLTSQAALVRFALVGGSGYLLYQVVLFLMYDSDLFWFLPAKKTSADFVVFEHGDFRFLIVTLAATAVTLIGVFAGHNLWTFRDRSSARKAIWMRFGQFVAAASMGVAIVIVTVNVLTVQFDIYHFVALPFAVSLAALWDWLLYSVVVWRPTNRRSLTE